jgi:hypothetical protein
MKFVCANVCKYTPDFVLFVLQCKCAWKVQDTLVHSLNMLGVTQVLVEGTNLYNVSTWTGGMKEHHDVIQSLIHCLSWLLLYT